ncbi:zinc-alpha-2-glycoprotein-like [Gracilinanus agilis]|uniref:zinc-alpha-2-glycoprotein-like n=1 Tax=Gracilinanus agilis TaxID=191870 RepID=UPI001CFE17BE|nr:zinc-alpha-2-glycoprotein-like [Gracilinanus agilis]
MMRPLVCAIFLFLLSGTIKSQYLGCDILQYEDVGFSNPTSGHYSFRSAASLNDQTVYIYDSRSKRAVPNPGWQNVENWNKVSKLQKKREDLIMKNFQEFRNSSKDYTRTYTITQILGCLLCQNDDFKIYRHNFVTGKEYNEKYKNILGVATEDPVPEMKKQQLKQDLVSLKLLNRYMEKQCVPTLQKYQNYKNAN